MNSLWPAACFIAGFLLEPILDALVEAAKEISYLIYEHFTDKKRKK